MTRRGTMVLAVLAALVSTSCSKRQEGPLSAATDPREAALVLLQAAQTGRTSKADLGAIVDASSAEQWTALGDALASLRGTNRARVASAEALGPDRTAVDLDVALSGGGSARYRVQAGRSADGSWRVVSLDGPGIAWPSSALPRDEGLSTSSPPRPAAR